MERVDLFPFYARELRRVLRRPRRAVAFALAIAMHAAGHAALALAAAGVALVAANGTRMDLLGSSPLGGRGAPLEQAFCLALLGLAAVTVKVGGGIYASYVQARIAADVGATLRLAVLDGLLAVHRLRRPRHGDQGDASPTHARRVAAMTAEVRDVQAGLDVGVLGGARATVQLAALVVVLLVLAPKLAIVAIAIFAPLSFLLGAARRRYKRASTRASREGTALLEAADEAARHAELWVTYGAEGKVRASVASIGDAIASRGARLAAGAAAMSGANELLGAAAVVCALSVARAGWLGEVGSGGAMLAFAVTFFLAYRPLRDLAEARLALARASAAHDELRAATAGDASTSDDVVVEAPARAVAWPLADLDVRDLVLTRGARSTRAAAISFRVPAGSIVAIAGATGAGKTTLLRALLGLDRARAGDVVFGGESIANADAGPASRPFAWVPQDAPLLADTLAANVALGAVGEVEDVDTRGALATLGADRLVDEVGASRLGAAGRAVSGGERQWIALARAIATELPVLLLDEPTSGLDPRSQAMVLAAIARLRGARSVILVTHRAEPLAIADAVVDLDRVDGAGAEPSPPLEATEPKGGVWTSS